MPIILSDGSTYIDECSTETKGPTTMAMETAAINIARQTSEPTRTRRQIVDDLEAAEAKGHDLQKAIVVERQKVAALTVELRNFGRRTKKART